MRGSVWILLSLLASGCATRDLAKVRVEAPLRTADGRLIGTVQMSDVRGSVRVVINATGLPAGPLGAHLHAVGRCEDAGFVAAGPHWNPTSRKHGHANPDGPHAGDLGNLAVGPGGTVRTDRTVRRTSLLVGDNPLIDADGTALIVHAKQDDERTDPSGNSGDRIACASFAGR